MPRKQHSRHIKAESFAAVIRDFLNSDRFRGYSPNTQDMWGRELRLAQRPELLGELSVDVIRPALVQAFLDGLADRPGKRYVARAALKQLERWALVRDRLDRSIMLGTEAPKTEGGHVPWTDEQVALAEAHARPELARAITLAAETGQRGSDLVRMCWTDIEPYDGRLGIRVTQRKTGMQLWIPHTPALSRALAGWERRPGPILLNSKGRPWRRQDLTIAWMHERARNPALAPLGAAGLVLHGLRATACVRLRRLGAELPQIADFVGMSQDMVGRYCRLSSQKENASAAVVFLEGRQGGVTPWKIRE
jgi:integrase